jgi:hypothetical protein
MSQRANVTAIDVIDSFRSKLIVYLSKARPTLEEVTGDVLRMRSWLENEQRTHWENQVRKRTKLLEQAQSELFSSRISNLREETAAEQQAFHRARRALDEAEAKLRTLKRWTREFDAQVQPLVKQMEKLHSVLSNDMVQAVAYLALVVKTLDAYAGMVAPSVSDSTAAPAQTEPGSEPPVAVQENPEPTA